MLSHHGLEKSQALRRTSTAHLGKVKARTGQRHLAHQETWGSFIAPNAQLGVGPRRRAGLVVPRSLGRRGLGITLLARAGFAVMALVALVCFANGF